MSAEGTPSETPGHKVLTDEQKDLVGGIRLLGDASRRLLDVVGQADVDQRWLAIARTHFQEGLMAAVRAVTKPDFF
jgi:hypothetical protein